MWQQLVVSSQTLGQEPWGIALLGFSSGGFLVGKVRRRSHIARGACHCVSALTDSLGSLNSLRTVGFFPKNGVSHHIPTKGYWVGMFCGH